MLESICIKIILWLFIQINLFIALQDRRKSENYIKKKDKYPKFQAIKLKLSL